MKIKTACLMIFLAWSIISWTDEKQPASAKELFYAQVKPAKPVKGPGNARHKTGLGRDLRLDESNGNTVKRIPTASTLTTGLRYQLLQRLPDGTEAPVDLDSSFQSGDRIRISFESNMKGYLYVVHQGSSGNWSVLFPDPRIN